MKRTDIVNNKELERYGLVSHYEPSSVNCHIRKKYHVKGYITLSTLYDVIEDLNAVVYQDIMMTSHVCIGDISKSSYLNRYRLFL